MPTRARKRRRPDVARMGRAMAQEGIDPRNWTATGRVESEEQARRWSTKSGWIADVTLTGGTVDQLTEVPCRVAGQNRGDGSGEFIPPGSDCEVSVVLNGGNAEEAPGIVGYYSNDDGCAPPTEIHSLPISGEARESNSAAVSPFDTELKVSPYNRREQYEGDWTIQAAEMVQIAENLKLGSTESGEAFVKGNAYSTALTDYLGQLATLLDALATALDAKLPASPGVSKALVTAFTNGPQTLFTQQLVEGQLLSDKIQGE